MPCCSLDVQILWDTMTLESENGILSYLEVATGHNLFHVTFSFGRRSVSERKMYVFLDETCDF